MDWTFVMGAISSHIPSANTLAAFAGAGSALAAFLTIKRAAASRENDRLLVHAVTTLERAFATLVGDSQRGSNPPADRLNWLTAARLIEDYKLAKRRVSDPLILQECESHEEHWRHQFYLRLVNLAGGTPEYYACARGGGIVPLSAIIIHSFADWPPGHPDPLDRYHDASAAAEQLQLSQKWFALRQFCNLI